MKHIHKGLFIGGFLMVAISLYGFENALIVSRYPLLPGDEVIALLFFVYTIIGFFIIECSFLVSKKE